MSFPTTRLRRLRQNEQLRSLVRETRLSPEALIYPLFVCPGEGVRKEVRSMPGVFNLSVDEAVKEARATKAAGVPSVILFGLPEKKDEVATGAWAEDGIVQQAARAIKGEAPDLIILGDVCLCEYMSHGHCGMVRQTGTAELDRGGDEVVAGFTTTYGSKAYAVSIKPVKTRAAAAPAAGSDYEIVNDETLE